MDWCAWLLYLPALPPRQLMPCSKISCAQWSPLPWRFSGFESAYSRSTTACCAQALPLLPALWPGGYRSHTMTHRAEGFTALQPRTIFSLWSAWNYFVVESDSFSLGSLLTKAGCRCCQSCLNHRGLDAITAVILSYFRSGVSRVQVRARPPPTITTFGFFYISYGLSASSSFSHVGKYSLLHLSAPLLGKCKPCCRGPYKVRHGNALLR